KAFLDQNLDNTKKNDVSQLVCNFYHDTNRVVEICTELVSFLENILLLLNELSESSTKKVEQENRNTASSSQQISLRELESLVAQWKEAMARTLEGVLKIRKTIKKEKWRKISKAIHTTLVIVILIVPVIVAAIAAPPVIIIVGPLATITVYSMGQLLEEENFKFISKLLRKFSKKLFGKEKMTVDMEKMKSSLSVEEISNCVKSPDWIYKAN
ncbi:hypothetical protein ZOSMA_3595G00010, partial [Zostera marina]